MTSQHFASTYAYAYAWQLAAATETAAAQMAECADACLAQAEKAPESSQVALLAIAAIYETTASAMRATVSTHLGAP